MLVRYRLTATTVLSTATMANVRSDINAIITGVSTTTSSLSNSCDKTNTLFYGQYPTGKYTLQRSTTATTYTWDTYSKVHNDYSDTTHFIRLAYNTATWAISSLTLATSYVQGTDVMTNYSEVLYNQYIGQITASFDGNQMTVTVTSGLNSLITTTLQVGDIVVGTVPGTPIVDPTTSIAQTSVQNAFYTGAGGVGTYGMNITQTSRTSAVWNVYRPTSLNIKPNPYNTFAQPYGLDIIVSTKCLYIGSSYSQVDVGIFDIGKNGVARLYTNNALMAGYDLGSELNGGTLPYTYKFNILAYSTQTLIALNSVVPQKKYNSSNALVVIENPTFLYQYDNGNVISVMYGLFKLPEQTFQNHVTYTDSGGVRRFTINDYSILTE